MAGFENPWKKTWFNLHSQGMQLTSSLKFFKAMVFLGHMMKKPWIVRKPWFWKTIVFLGYITGLKDWPWGSCIPEYCRIPTDSLPEIYDNQQLVSKVHPMVFCDLFFYIHIPIQSALAGLRPTYATPYSQSWPGQSRKDGKCSTIGKQRVSSM